MTRAEGWTLFAAILASGIVFLDSTVVNVALPRIGRELPSSVFGVLEGQSYVYNAYLLTLSALLVLAGALNDFFGRRRMFAFGLAGFLVTSLLCGVAPSMELLIAFAAVVALAVGGLSFGTIYSQQREWRDPFGFATLAIGLVATVALPFLMTMRRDPLIPPSLFRSRNFSVTNISTFLIYGALYVIGYFLTLFVQSTVGYTAAAAGLTSLPSGLFLMFLSSRFGALAARFGPRRFMAIGPALMFLAVLWYARIPATTEAWRFAFGDPSTDVPPTSYLIDLLPASLVYGIGLSIMVAPLTTALMTSVPVHNAGVASAVNNAISRVGPQLASALIFVAITASFYAGLHDRVPSLNVSDADVRRTISPLNVVRAPSSLPPETAGLIQAEREASTEAFHLAMLVAAALLAAGAVTNAVGIVDDVAKKPATERR